MKLPSSAQTSTRVVFHAAKIFILMPPFWAVWPQATPILLGADKIEDRYIFGRQLLKKHRRNESIL